MIRDSENTGFKINNKLKTVVISILSIVIIILLYFYFIKGDKSSFNEIKSEGQIPVEKITGGIDSILYTFGIKKEWIKDITGKSTSNNKSTNEISKEILIPDDVPLVEVNHELTNYFTDSGYGSKITEDPRTKNMTIRILKSINPGKDTALLKSGIVKIFYNDTLKRNAAEVCVIIDSIDSQSLNNAEEILSSSQAYTLFLPLRNDKADFQQKIIELKKDYIIKLFIGDETAIEADFKNDMKESLWKSKIKSICLNFPMVSGIILSSNKDLSDFETRIKNEFENNNVKVFEDTMLTQISRDTGKVDFLFNDIISKTKKGKHYLFYSINFNPQEFAEFEKKVYRLKKSGYKFFSFKELLKRKEKKENRNAESDSTRNLIQSKNTNDTK